MVNALCKAQFPVVPCNILAWYYHVHVGPPLGSKNFKKLHEKFTLNPPKSPKFGTNHVFAATWPMESFDCAAKINGRNIFDGAKMPNQPRWGTLASWKGAVVNKIWWESIAFETFWCFSGHWHSWKLSRFLGLNSHTTIRLSPSEVITLLD